MPRKLTKAGVDFWESLQVELQGQYSVKRLIDLHNYSSNVGLAEMVFLLLLTPLPCLVMVVLGDAVPLNRPEAGTNANGVLWMRGLLVLWCFTLSFAVQLKEMLSILPMSWRRLHFMSVVITGVGVAFSYSLSLAIGFPIPFMMLLTAPVWSTLFLSACAISWGTYLRGNKNAQALIMEWLLVFTIQTSLIGVYPFFNYGFLNLQAWPTSQAAFSLVLQVIKIAAKNAISRCMLIQTDMKPEMIIFNVEVFNALFVSFCMQNATSQLTMAVIMTVDFLHMAVSLRDVVLLVREVKTIGILLGSRNPQKGNYASSTINMLEISSRVASRQIFVRQRTSTLTKDNPKKCSRSLLKQLCGAVSANRVRPLKTVKVSQAPQLPLDGALPSSAPTNEVRLPDMPEASDQSVEALETLYLQKVTKLLHLTECTILVEYTEVIVPIVYSIYVVAMSYLPNRVYYPEPKTMDSDGLEKTLFNVLLYALLEFISLVVLDVVLRRLVHFSPVSQLAFVLRTQWRMVQSKLVLWVVYVVQFSLVHFAVFQGLTTVFASHGYSSNKNPTNSVQHDDSESSWKNQWVNE